MRNSFCFLFALTAAATGCIGAEDSDASGETAGGEPVGEVAAALAPIHDDTSPGWTYTGTWGALVAMAGAMNNTLHLSAVTSSEAKFTCTGTVPNTAAFDLIFSRAYNRGFASIWVTPLSNPGQIFGLQQVDMYGSGVARQQRIHFSAFTSLSAGQPYEVHVRVDGTKNPASSGYFVDIDGIECNAGSPAVAAAGTQPNIKGAYWLRFDDNYNIWSTTDDRRVAWNLETPGFGGFDPVHVAELHTSYGIRTIVRLGDDPKPSPAELAALASPGFTCSQINGFMSDLDAEAGLVDGAIAASPQSIGAFIFGNEVNLEWPAGGAAYARAYNCYVARWNTGPKKDYPLLMSGPGGCNQSNNCPTFYNDLFAHLGLTVDGFGIHAYTWDKFRTNPEGSGFEDQANRINQSRPGSPIYITEFNPGPDQNGNLPPLPMGWADYFNQRFNEVRTFNQSHAGQIKALIYFVDSPTHAGTPHARTAAGCPEASNGIWYQTSLCDFARRSYWLNAPSAPAAGNQADIVEGLSNVPTFLMPGQLSHFSFFVRNHGATTWPETGSSLMYRLGADTGNGFTWSSFPQCGGYNLGLLNSRIFTCSPGVSPGGSYSYQLDARAPTNNAPSATLSVRMVQDGAQWFGYGAKLPVALGKSYCGTALTQCILSNRPDILPFYAGNGWDTSCGNRDNVINNWCSMDPAGCNGLKANACAAFNNSCRCTGGIHVDGTPIDPNGTFCGYKVCGTNHHAYECQAGWIDTGASCD